MFDIGFFEILVIGVLALLVLGPERLPGAIRSTLKTVRSVRNMASGFKQEVEHQLRVHELHENLKKAEQQGLKDLTPELQDSVDELKKAAESVQEPYKKPQMSEENSLISHLIELRTRILRALLSVMVVFLCLAYFANDLYQLLAEPLLNTLPDNASMIATDVASPFFAPFKLTLVLSFFIAIPFVLYQVWGFVAPGLYRNEKKLVAPLLLSSTLLFYAGMAFAYFVVFPIAFAFFTSVAPEGVTVATDINSYLNFVLKLFFAFGMSFEIPVAIVLLCWTGITDADSLRQKRPYVVVAAFIVGMLLTPPDVISQTLLAVPMWILFEFGVIVGGIYSKKDDEDASAE